MRSTCVLTPNKLLPAAYSRDSDVVPTTNSPCVLGCKLMDPAAVCSPIQRIPAMFLCFSRYIISATQHSSVGCDDRANRVRPPPVQGGGSGSRVVSECVHESLRVAELNNPCCQRLLQCLQRRYHNATTTTTTQKLYNTLAQHQSLMVGRPVKEPATGWKPVPPPPTAPPAAGVKSTKTPVNHSPSAERLYSTSVTKSAVICVCL